MANTWEFGVQRSAPSVTCCGDAVLIAGYGSLATLMWKASPVMRLSVRPAGTSAGGVVVMAGDDVLVEVSNEAQGALLVARIESAIRESVVRPSGGWLSNALSRLVHRVPSRGKGQCARKARWPARSLTSAG